jgi:hypothetical protein
LVLEVLAVLWVLYRPNSTTANRGPRDVLDRGGCEQADVAAKQGDVAVNKSTLRQNGETLR